LAAILSVALAALGSSSYSVDVFHVTMPIIERRARHHTRIDGRNDEH